MEYYVSVAPTTEPVSLAEVRQHLRMDDDFFDHDEMLTGLIIAARQSCEDFCKRAFMTQTVVAKLDDFSDLIVLPWPRVSSVSSIQYLDTDGNSQTLSTSYYNAHMVGDAAAVELAYGYTWPGVYSQKNAVTITFVSGYGGASSVPWAIKYAILIMVADLYNNPESIVIGGGAVNQVPLTSERLLGPYVSRGVRL